MEQSRVGGKGDTQLMRLAMCSITVFVVERFKSFTYEELIKRDKVSQLGNAGQLARTFTLH